MILSRHKQTQYVLTDCHRTSARDQHSNERVDQIGVVGFSTEALIDEFRYEVCVLYIQRCRTLRWRWGSARQERQARELAA